MLQNVKFSSRIRHKALEFPMRDKKAGEFAAHRYSKSVSRVFHQTVADKPPMFPVKRLCPQEMTLTGQQTQGIAPMHAGTVEIIIDHSRPEPAVAHCRHSFGTRLIVLAENAQLDAGQDEHYPKSQHCFPPNVKVVDKTEREEYRVLE